MSNATGRSCPLEDVHMIRTLLGCALLAAAAPALAVDGLPDSSFGVFSSGRNLISIDIGSLNIDLLAKTLVSADGSIFRRD